MPVLDDLDERDSEASWSAGGDSDDDEFSENDDDYEQNENECRVQSIIKRRFNVEEGVMEYSVFIVLLPCS